MNDFVAALAHPNARRLRCPAASCRGLGVTDAGPVLLEGQPDALIGFSDLDAVCIHMLAQPHTSQSVKSGVESLDEGLAIAVFGDDYNEVDSAVKFVEAVAAA